jgi:hypothetical protein
MSSGTGNCPQGASVGSDGRCYKNCPPGYAPLQNGSLCIADCPQGYGPSASADNNAGSCIRPAFEREVKPNLACPPGADRQFDKCLLDCPLGTHKDFNLCVPDCPPNFVETPDGLSCQAEFFKRVATVREACYANETRIAGRICLAPCDAGTVPLETNSELCYATVPAQFQPFFWTGDPKFQASIGPLVSKVIFARAQAPATCLTNFVSMNGQCFADCPSNSTAVGTQCLANCPRNFNNTANQTACIRPTIQRQRVLNIWQRAESVFVTVGIIIGTLLAVSLVFNIFQSSRTRRATQTAQSIAKSNRVTAELEAQAQSAAQQALETVRAPQAPTNVPNPFSAPGSADATQCSTGASEGT